MRGVRAPSPLPPPPPAPSPPPPPPPYPKGHPPLMPMPGPGRCGLGQLGQKTPRASPRAAQAPASWRPVSAISPLAQRSPQQPSDVQARLINGYPRLASSCQKPSNKHDKKPCQFFCREPIAHSTLLLSFYPVCPSRGIYYLWTTKTLINHTSGDGLRWTHAVRALCVRSTRGRTGRRLHRINGLRIAIVTSCLHAAPVLTYRQRQKATLNWGANSNFGSHPP